MGFIFDNELRIFLVDPLFSSISFKFLVMVLMKLDTTVDVSFIPRQWWVEPVAHPLGSCVPDFDHPVPLESCKDRATVIVARLLPLRLCSRDHLSCA